MFFGRGGGKRGEGGGEGRNICLVVLNSHPSKYAPAHTHTHTHTKAYAQAEEAIENLRVKTFNRKIRQLGLSLPSGTSRVHTTSILTQNGFL